jgi:hypothetical protein
MEDTILKFQDKFDQAELHGDTGTLRQLIADDFQSIGPRGFVMNKQEWIDRHRLFKYLQLDITERNVQLYDKAAIVRNVQSNKAVYSDQHVDIMTRVMQVWVEINGQWQLAGIQFSPLAKAG